MTGDETAYQRAVEHAADRALATDWPVRVVGWPEVVVVPDAVLALADEAMPSTTTLVRGDGRHVLLFTMPPGRVLRSGPRSGQR